MSCNNLVKRSRDLIIMIAIYFDAIVTILRDFELSNAIGVLYHVHDEDISIADDMKRDLVDVFIHLPSAAVFVNCYVLYCVYKFCANAVSFAIVVVQVRHLIDV